MFALSPFAFPSISVPTGEGDMELIFSSTLTSDTNSFSTGTLPTGYKAFQIYIKARTDRDNIHDNIAVYFNGDLADSNYQVFRITANTITAPINISQNLPALFQTPGGSGQANFFSGATMVAYDPENTTQFKSFTFLQGRHSHSSSTSSGERSTMPGSGVWRDQSAITSITFKAVGTNSNGTAADLVSGSSFHVYGLK